MKLFFAKITIGLIISAFLCMGILLLNTFLQIRMLPTIENAEVFVRNFDAINQQTVELSIGGLEGRTIRSPYFPYKTLETKMVIQAVSRFTYTNDGVIDKSTTGRYYNVDPFWKVFWVEIVESEKPAQFYGAFRISE